MSDLEVDEHTAAAAAEAHEESGAVHRRHPSPKEYVRIGVLLFAITACEVAIYYVRDGFGLWYIPALFMLALLKFSLVVLWFMHLRFDDRRFARFFLMGLSGAVTLYLVVLISFKVFLR